jgi:hypothetical protein
LLLSGKNPTVFILSGRYFVSEIYSVARDAKDANKGKRLLARLGNQINNKEFQDVPTLSTGKKAPKVQRNCEIGCNFTRMKLNFRS